TSTRPSPRAGWLQARLSKSIARPRAGRDTCPTTSEGTAADLVQLCAQRYASRRSMPGGATSVRVQPENAERPRRAPSPEAVAALKEAASALDVEELLALCYSFQKDSFRLGVYLDVLRRKGGQKAQAAACLVCFDLARRGERSFEGEFLALVPVMRAFLDDSEGTRPLDPLIGESPYLRALSSELEALLRTMDPRWDHGGA